MIQAKKTNEYIQQNLKAAGWSAIAESVATIVLGALLILAPVTVIKIIAYVAGGFFLLKGILQIISYFKMKNKYNYYNNGLFFGVISVIIGVASIVSGVEISGLFRIVMGIWLLYAGLTRMDTAFKMRTSKIEAWKYIMILAVTMMMLGLVLFFCEGAVMMLIGWIIMFAGIMSLVDDVMFMSSLNRFTAIKEGEIISETNKK